MTSSTSSEKLSTAEVAAKVPTSERKALRYSSIVLLCLVFACVVLVRDLRVSAKEAVPRVQPLAAPLRPRQLRDPPSQSIPPQSPPASQSPAQALEKTPPG